VTLPPERGGDILVEISNINSLIIITTLIYKIPPNLPFPKEGVTPLWQRGARGDFPVFMSIQF
jgi:hypothetical protein